MNAIKSTQTLLLATAVFRAVVLPNHAETWPGFRGAAGVGVSLETKLPSKWSADDNIKWKLELPGRGNSSPVVTSDRVYLSTHTEDRGLWVLAIDKGTGELIWKERMSQGQLAAWRNHRPLQRLMFGEDTPWT